MSDLWPALITTVGALAGSFGGFTLAARTQRLQSERDDKRAALDAARAREIQLEDERHEFQLTTLLALQELTRRHTRSTLLVIQQDRKTLEAGAGYRLLEKDSADDFTNSIEFAHNIARVTNASLRSQLRSFSERCTAYSMPPTDWNELSKEDGIALQEQRFYALIHAADETTEILGTHLRSELDRHNRTSAMQG